MTATTRWVLTSSVTESPVKGDVNGGGVEVGVGVGVGVGVRVGVGDGVGATVGRGAATVDTGGAVVGVSTIDSVTDTRLSVGRSATAASVATGARSAVGVGVAAGGAAVETAVETAGGAGSGSPHAARMIPNVPPVIQRSNVRREEIVARLTDGPDFVRIAQSRSK